MAPWKNSNSVRLAWTVHVVHNNQQLMESLSPVGPKYDRTNFKFSRPESEDNGVHCFPCSCPANIISSAPYSSISSRTHTYPHEISILNGFEKDWLTQTFKMDEDVWRGEPHVTTIEILFHEKYEDKIHVIGLFNIMKLGDRGKTILQQQVY